jgi:alanine dehydrogenase
VHVGIPKEVKDSEYRVAATPEGVRELVRAGHRVVVEASAGVGSAIADEHFELAGAEIVADADAVFAEAELIVKVKEPRPEEYERFRPGQVLFTYLHLAADERLTRFLAERNVTSVAYETVQTGDGRLPLLAPMSEIAGRMAPQEGAASLERPRGGRGVLMGGASGVAPARVVVLGAGMAGANAAQIAAGMEAEVTVVDRNVDRLRDIDRVWHGRIQTVMSSALAVERLVVGADMVIGAVLVPGARAPHLVSAETVSAMHSGSVLVDISIDQGGCFETSHVTTHSDPTFVVDEVVHYCVGNMPGAVPRTSTYALTNVTLPYVAAIADHGIDEAVRADPALALGVNVVAGAITNEGVGAAHGLEVAPIAQLIGGGEG